MLAGNGALISTGEVARRGVERREGQRLLNAIFCRRDDRIASLQRQADQTRAELQAGLDAVDGVLNLARRPGGAGLVDAQAQWPSSMSAMDSARKSAGRLPVLTGDILRLAAEQRDDLARLAPRQTDPAAKRYLQLLREAHVELIGTTTRYEEMNSRVAEGMPLYESLVEITDRFLREERSGTFRGSREASQVYTSRSERLIPELRTFNQELDAIAEDAATEAADASAAFTRANAAGRGVTLRPKKVTC